MGTAIQTGAASANAPHTILVATDFDNCAEAALDRALALASALHAKVYLFHAYSLPVAAFPGGNFAPSAEIAPKIIAAAQASLDAAIAKRKQSGDVADVELVPVLVQGDPSESVLAAASKLGADLIVVGTHGRHGWKRALLGSVAESLVRVSPVPVMTVHAS